MGIQDRHYYREGPGPSSSGGLGVGGMSMWSITTWLIVINVAVFVLDGLLFRSGLVYVFAAVMTEDGIRDAIVPLADYQALEASGRARALSPFPMGPLEAWGYFSFTTAVGQLQVWRWITFQFLHASIGHIFGNMLGLYFFGSMIEQYLGRRKYLAFYLLCGIAGPVVYLFFAWIKVLGMTLAVPMVGASAGVFGVLMAAATVAPNTTVMLLFPPIPMKLRTLALVLLGLAAFTVFTQGHNAGGEAAHLGGAALGFLLIRNPRLLGWAEAGFRRLPGAKSSNMTYHGWR